ncbi:MAG: hypothetical protein WDN72_02410 [Alphaproteobacteria bacterium]
MNMNQIGTGTTILTADSIFTAPRRSATARCSWAMAALPQPDQQHGHRQ